MVDKHELMTVNEVAEYLRMGRNTIRRLLINGDIPGQHFGRQWRIPRRAIMAIGEVKEDSE